MSKQRSKRSRGYSKDLWVPHYRGMKPFEGNAPGYLYRQVEEPSIERLNNSTRGIRSANATRMVDYFTLALAYPAKLQRLRQLSRLATTPTPGELARQLGKLPVTSLSKPVVADVVDVKQYSGSVGVTVVYPGYEKESAAITSYVQHRLGFPESFEPWVGAGELHISMLRGTLSGAQMKSISGCLPQQIHLSEVKSS